MFDWLWTRKSDRIQFESAGGNLFGPIALAKSIISNVEEYMLAANAREFSIPAWKRRLEEPRSSVREVWQDTRTESLTALLLHGRRDWEYLTGPAHQLELIETYEIDRPHLKFPQMANGDQLHDTIQAVWQCIAYLHQAAFDVGTRIEVMDGIVPHFEQRMTEARAWWQEKDAASRCYGLLTNRERPPLMIYILWEEVTIAAKEIAFTHIYGSNWQAGLQADIEYWCSRVPTQAAELRRQHASMVDRMRAAVEPDDLVAGKPF
jgi:hypothetical protein